MTAPFYLVDAFAHEPFAGNPAAVVLLQTWLPDATLQAMAAEHNLSETAFFTASDRAEADFDIRWFTPTTEVPLCGHATLASGHVIFDHLGFDSSVLRLATREKGVLRLTRTEPHTYTLSLPAEEQRSIPVDEDLAKRLGLTILEAYEGKFLVLVLPSAGLVKSYAPDFGALKALNKEVVLTAKAGTSPFEDLDFVSRMFAPCIGIDEDPVTGAAHAQLTPYWSLVLQKTDLKAGQIGPREGRLGATLQGTEVILTGTARTYLVGQIQLSFSPSFL